MRGSSGNFLQGLSESTRLKEVKVNCSVSTLKVLSLLVNSSFQLEWNTFNRVWKVLEILCQGVAALLVYSSLLLF